MPTNSPAPSPSPWYRVVWRYTRGSLIFLFVVFHLLLLAIRNPLDIYYKDIIVWLKEEPAWGGWSSDEDDPPPTWWDRYGEEFQRVDQFTYRYANLFGVEQGWNMFTPPVAREAYFLAVRLEFRDGTSALLISDNEPIDPTRYFRLGGWQTRKLEEILLRPPDDFGTDPKVMSMWTSYARHAVRKWQAGHPEDSRKVEHIVFLRRRIDFPKPGENYEDSDTRYEEDFATFDEEGRLIP